MTESEFERAVETKDEALSIIASGVSHRADEDDVFERIKFHVELAKKALASTPTQDRQRAARKDE